MQHNIINLPPKRKYLRHEYPNNIAREITYDEAVSTCYKLSQQLTDVDQIIGIARSGMPFATWISQMLNIDLGYYNPVGNVFALVNNPKKIAFIDETSEWGHTQNKIRVLMQQYSNIEYVICSVWIDCFHPQFNGYAADDIIYGEVLDQWITKFAGVEKNFDEQRIKFREKKHDIK